MELSIIFWRLGVALGLGLLVGLQRERVASRLAGVRTFPLVTILGSLSALLAQSAGGWVVAAGFLGLAVVVFANKSIEFREGPPDPGLTTEVALLLMFGVGAYAVFGHVAVAVAVGGVVAVLLHFKVELHGLVSRLGDNDLKAIMQFVLISLVVLPVLPNKAFGPFAVLNPHKIWWMVVLVVGISLVGYIIYRFRGENAGVLAGGFLGGVISSTATTVSYSRRTADSPEGNRQAAIVIMIASAVVYARLAVIVGAISASFLASALAPLLLLLLVTGVVAAWIFYRGRKVAHEPSPPSNPTELRSALLFGLFYALALLAVAAAREFFGTTTLYVVAGLAGLTDLDAIAVSTAQFVAEGRIAADIGWRLIVLASLTNLVFKGIVAWMLGSRRLLALVAPLFGTALLAGILILLLWPAGS